MNHNKAKRKYLILGWSRKSHKGVKDYFTKKQQKKHTLGAMAAKGTPNAYDLVRF